MSNQVFWLSNKIISPEDNIHLSLKRVTQNSDSAQSE